MILLWVLPTWKLLNEDRYNFIKMVKNIKFYFCSEHQHFIKLGMSNMLKTHLQRRPYSYYFKIVLSNAWDVWNDLLKSQVSGSLELCSFIKTPLIPLPTILSRVPVQPGYPTSLPPWPVTGSHPWSISTISFLYHGLRPVSFAIKQATNLWLTSTQRRLQQLLLFFLTFLDT